MPVYEVVERRVIEFKFYVTAPDGAKAQWAAKNSSEPAHAVEPIEKLTHLRCRRVREDEVPAGARTIVASEVTPERRVRSLDGVGTVVP